MDTQGEPSQRQLTLGARLFVATLIGAPLLPWVVGAVAKLYLQSAGKPTLPWSYFLEPSKLIGDLLLSGAFALPFILYAAAAWWILAAPHLGLDDDERRWLVIPGFALGVVAYIWNSWIVFLVYEPLLFFVPYYAAGIALGFVLGGVVIISRRIGHGRTAPHA